MEMGHESTTTNPLSALDHGSAEDMDLGLDNPAPAPKPAKFQPKFKPKTKPKEEPTALPDDALHMKNAKKEEDHSSIPTKPPEPLHSFNITKAAKGEAKEEAMDIDANEENEDVDEEDRVVREIDVFFTPPLDTNSQLYVMQYPLRPCWRPYELNERCQEVRVKPKQGKLEVDLELNVGTDNYDDDVSEHLRLQNQTLTSSKAPFVTGYAIGVLKGHKLHLSPIHTVVQLRPSMAYVNGGKGRKKSSVTGGAEVAANSNDATKEESAKSSRIPSSVQGKLAPETPNEQNPEDLEPWTPLEYHDLSSAISRRYRQYMVAEENSHIQFSMSSYYYVDSLCPGVSNDNMRARVPSRRALLSLPLEERFKRWLKMGPPIHRFASLLHLAPESSVEDVLKIVQQLADLVQGLWVLKSSLLCDGVQAMARDYILFLFSKRQFIHRDQIKGLRVPNEIMKSILSSLAVERSAFQDWKFREPADLLFIKAHPDIVEQQKQAWSKREEYIMGAIHGIGRKGVAAMPKNPSQPSVADRGLTSSNVNHVQKGDSVGMRSFGMTTMSDETREALPKALLELFHIHKVCSLQLISQGLRDMAVSKSTHPKADARVAVAAAKAAEASLEELQSIISKIAINIHGVYVLKSLGNPTIDPLRNVVINLLMAKEPNAKLKKADIVEAAKIVLKREISSPEYTQVMTELCSSRGGTWVLKNGDGKSR